MPSISFRRIDRSQEPYEAVALPVVQMLEDLPSRHFGLAVSALNDWWTLARYDSDFADWERLLRDRATPSSFDYKVHRTLLQFYETVKKMAVDGVWALGHKDKRECHRGQKVLDKARGEILEQITRRSRAGYFDEHCLAANCEILIDGNPAVAKSTVDVDVAAWSTGDSEGEVASCKCRPSSLQGLHVVDLAELKTSVEEACGDGSLKLYLVTLDSTDMLRRCIWQMQRESPVVDASKYMLVGKDRLAMLKRPKPYKDLSA